MSSFEIARNQAGRIVLLPLVAIITGALAACAHGPSMNAKHPGKQQGGVIEVDGKPRVEDVVVEKKNESDTYYYFLVAQELKDSGDIKGAIEYYKKVLAIDESSALVHSELAYLYYKHGDIDRALLMAKKAVELAPSDVRGRLMLGDLYLVDKKYDESIAEFGAVIKLDPKNQRPYLILGNIYVNNNDHDRAIEIYKKLISEVPDSVVGLYYLGLAESEMGRLNDALEHLNKAVELGPEFPSAHVELGRLYENKGDNAKAIEIYTKAIGISPHEYSVRKLLARVLVAEKRYEEALEQYEELKKVSHSALDAYTKKGLIYMDKLGMNDEAAVEFEGALKIDADNSRLRFYLATVCEKAGKPEKAAVEFSKIKKNDEWFVEAKRRAAKLFASLDKKTEAGAERDAAIKVLEEEVKKAPGDADRHYLLGELYDESGNWDNFLKHMNAVIAINPRHVNALNYLGYALAERGMDLDKAESYIKRALAEKPESGDILDSLGWVYFKKGELKKAVAELERATKYLPEDPTVAEHLGDVYLKSSNKRKAEEAYGRAASLSPGNEALKEKLRNVRRELEKEKE
ncbi:MAG: tetratricopeptide repeat protein [Deltaproteobacteria bacterium]|nr:tetratricopeptide repeat protein [Deltaproteobacteria bacterium]